MSADGGLLAAPAEPARDSGLRLKMPRPSRSFLLSSLSVATLLAAWVLVTHMGWANELFLPKPEAVWNAFAKTMTKGYQGSTLPEHVGTSLYRILVAFALACLVGIPIGVLMGASRDARALLNPLIEFYRPLPPLGLYTLLVMWLGIGDTSKVALLFLAALPPLSISAMQAARSIDIGHIRAAQMLGATRTQLFRHVFLPSCLPGICTGMRISLGFTYTVLVASEIVAATAGVGWMIWDASKFLLSDVVIMGLFVLGLTGLLLDWFIRQLERLITPWRFI